MRLAGYLAGLFPDSPQQNEQETTQIPNNPPVDLSTSIVFSPMPTPMEEFQPTNTVLMTPQRPPLDPLLSPGVPTTAEPPQMEYGGMVYRIFYYLSLKYN